MKLKSYVKSQSGGDYTVVNPHIRRIRKKKLRIGWILVFMAVGLLLYLVRDWAAVILIIPCSIVLLTFVFICFGRRKRIIAKIKSFWHGGL